MLCHFSVLVMETAYTGKFLEGEGGGGKRKREREREREREKETTTLWCYYVPSHLVLHVDGFARSCTLKHEVML